MRIHGRVSLQVCTFLTLAAATGAPAFAQGRNGAAAATNDFYRFNYNSGEEMQRIDYPAQPISTDHQITLHGETIDYTARVGFMPIKQATSGVTEGHLFYVYYAKKGVTDKSKRPVWFLFNGGPGAATVWLHMGAFGPKMVKMAPNGLATPPPYTYVDNPNCLLDTGDLVFIDAMGTGFSRPDKPAFGPDFGGVENDLAAFGEFIRSFLNQYNLWGSPLLVGGESYGTTRAAGLAGYLTDRDIPINGVMLLSAVIDANASAGEQRQLQTLPTEIMTAHFHKKQAPDLQKLTVEQMAKQARDFASGEYLEYLFDGARAPLAEREKVLTDFSRFTGLSKSYVDGLDLRVGLGPFSTELMRDQHMMTSRLDSRFAGYQLDAGASNTSFDFSNANIEDCFLTAFEAYIRNDLNYKNDNLYYVSGNAPPWSGEYNTVTNLETGFAKNPHMKLFVGMGYYDFACPFYPVEWTVAHLKVSDEIKKNNISMGYYESGHMVYIDQPAAAKYHADLVKFVQGAVPKYATRLKTVPFGKLLGGVSRFQEHVYPEHQELFEKLALGQRPDALFITCADSRIDPCLLTQTKPGELFICRVIGNIVPPYPDALGGVSATIEYAAGVLRTPEIVVCGHTDCGVMRGALNPDALADYPNVTAWLRYAQIDRREPDPTPEFLLALAERNVRTQLANLRTHPAVAARLAAGDLTLHGWVYHIGSGAVTAYDETTGQFLAP